MTAPNTVRDMGAMTQASKAFWPLLWLGTVALYGLMAFVAGRLGSLRGEYGLAVGAVILCAALALDWSVFTRSLRTSWRELGLTPPHLRGMIAAGLIALLLLATLPLAALLTGAPVSLRADWAWLIPGLLAQAGLAEELVFRGFLYGRIRQDRPFWRAVLLSIPPFALAHLAMFATLPFEIAAASLALAILMCAPLAQLYELGGRSIWAPALAHATVQGAIKLIVFDDARLPLIWIAACALIPFAAFFFRRDEHERASSGT
ncbi:MAG: CPBP family intramembrane glutamic endopeptidase [Hyphomonadaceae bacterium]|nr:CPBP family intramembrane glutamic endopeptidase [Hyphomonadaceae bacterium]